MEQKKDDRHIITNYLTFRMCQEIYAANVANVVNIQELTTITEVPKSPDYFLGIINLRGKVLPVIDGRKKLNLCVSENTVNTCILVMEVSGRDTKTNIGMLVDEVDEVIEIEQEQIQPQPLVGKNQKEDVVLGLYKPQSTDKFTIVLNVNKLLSSGELANIQSNSPSVSIVNE